MAVRILLADDHELTRLGMRMLICSIPGWEVCGEASNGWEAVTKVRELNPEVVVLDLSMAGMNGFEAAAEIRQVAPRTKIVFCSMHDVPATAKRVGADEFVSKAGSPQELLAAIERVTAPPTTEKRPDPKARSAGSGQ